MLHPDLPIDEIHALRPQIEAAIGRRMFEWLFCEPQTATRTDPASDRLISTKEAARLLAISEKAVREQFHAGRLPGERIGKLIRIYEGPVRERLAMGEANWRRRMRVLAGGIR